MPNTRWLSTARPAVLRPALAALLVLGGCGRGQPEHGDRPAAGQADRPEPALQPAPQDTAPPFLDPTEVVAGTGTDPFPVVLQAVRTAGHAGYDRVVFEFSGEQLPGYTVSYTDQPVRRCGSGREVPLAGEGRLVVQLRPAQAHDATGNVTVAERERSPGLAVLRELTLICDFEALVEWAVGLPAPARYRVWELSGPPRLVVDLAHRP